MLFLSKNKQYFVDKYELYSLQVSLSLISLQSFCFSLHWSPSNSHFKYWNPLESIGLIFLQSSDLGVVTEVSLE